MLFDFRNIYQANKIPTFTVKKENKTYTFVVCQTMSKTFIIKGCVQHTIAHFSISCRMIPKFK